MSISKNEKNIAIKIISLLLVDDKLGYKEKSLDIAKRANGHIKVPEILLGVEQDNLSISRLKELINWIISLKEKDCNLPVMELKTQVEYCAQSEAWIKDALMEFINSCENANEKELVDTQVVLNHDLKEFVTGCDMRDLIKTLYKDGIVNDGVSNPKEFALNAVAKLTPFTLTAETNGASNQSQGELCIGLTDEETLLKNMADAFAKDRQKRHGGLIYKTGYTAINKMLRGGIRGGEFIINIAMKFNFKSGLLVNVFRQVITYNKPPVTTDGKKPTIVFITFEQDLAALYYFLYAGIIENKYRRPLTEEEAVVDDMTKALVVYNHFKETGWNVVIKHQIGNFWNYEDFFQYTDKLEANGCKIFGIFSDYLYKISREGCDQSKIIGEDTKLLFSRIRDKYKLTDTFFWTPHQMSKSAREFLNYGTGLLVEDVCGKGLLEGCGSLDNVVDVEIYQHKEIDRRSGMTSVSLLRGKHKLEGEVENREDLLAFLWFNEYQKNKIYVSGILDDINHPPMYSHKLSEAPLGLRGESVVFDNDIEDF